MSGGLDDTRPKHTTLARVWMGMRSADLLLNPHQQGLALACEVRPLGRHIQRVEQLLHFSPRPRPSARAKYRATPGGFARSRGKHLAINEQPSHLGSYAASGVVPARYSSCIRAARASVRARS